MVMETSDFLGLGAAQVVSDYSSSSEDEEDEFAPLEAEQVDAEVSSASPRFSMTRTTSKRSMQQKRALDKLARHIDSLKVHQAGHHSKRPKGAGLSAVRSAGSAANQGHRSAMEDRLSLKPNLLPGTFFAGVFDGHNGQATSQALKELLHQRVSAALLAAKQEGCQATTWTDRLLVESFLDFDLELLAQARERQGESKPGEARRALKSCKSSSRFTDPCRLRKSAADLPADFASGSTATVLLASAEQVSVAWVGDSRAVLCRGGRAVPLTKDHRSSDADEATRVRAAGGVISSNGRLYHDINLSRAFGSFKHKLHNLDAVPAERNGQGERDQRALDRAVQPRNPLLAEPEVVTFQPGDDDEFVLIATDGVWDVLDNGEAVRLVRQAMNELRLNAAEAADRVVSRALQLGSGDNVSAVVACLR